MFINHAFENVLKTIELFTKELDPKKENDDKKNDDKKKNTIVEDLELSIQQKEAEIARLQKELHSAQAASQELIFSSLARNVATNAISAETEKRDCESRIQQLRNDIDRERLQNIAKITNDKISTMISNFRSNNQTYDFGSYQNDQGLDVYLNGVIAEVERVTKELYNNDTNRLNNKMTELENTIKKTMNNILNLAVNDTNNNKSDVLQSLTSITTMIDNLNTSLNNREFDEVISRTVGDTIAIFLDPTTISDFTILRQKDVDRIQIARITLLRSAQYDNQTQLISIINSNQLKIMNQLSSIATTQDDDQSLSTMNLSPAFDLESISTTSTDIIQKLNMIRSELITTHKTMSSTITKMIEQLTNRGNDIDELIQFKSNEWNKKMTEEHERMVHTNQEILNTYIHDLSISVRHINSEEIQSRITDAIAKVERRIDETNQRLSLELDFIDQSLKTNLDAWIAKINSTLVENISKVNIEQEKYIDMLARSNILATSIKDDNITSTTQMKNLIDYINQTSQFVHTTIESLLFDNKKEVDETAISLTTLVATTKEQSNLFQSMTSSLNDVRNELRSVVEAIAAKENDKNDYNTFLLRLDNQWDRYTQETKRIESRMEEKMEERTKKCDTTVLTKGMETVQQNLSECLLLKDNIHQLEYEIREKSRMNDKLNEQIKTLEMMNVSTTEENNHFMLKIQDLTENYKKVSSEKSKLDAVVVRVQHDNNILVDKISKLETKIDELITCDDIQTYLREQNISYQELVNFIKSPENSNLSTISELKSSISEIEPIPTKIDKIETQLQSLSNRLESYVAKDDILTSISEIRTYIKEIPSTANYEATIANLQKLLHLQKKESKYVEVMDAYRSTMVNKADQMERYIKKIIDDANQLVNNNTISPTAINTIIAALWASTTAIQIYYGEIKTLVKSLEQIHEINRSTLDASTNRVTEWYKSLGLANID